MSFIEDAAENIVREISDTIHQSVNLMDDEGKIIASTDPGRIGGLHEGAKKIIQEKLDCLEVYRDEEYRGTKVGINLPIQLNGTIVGVIGISGEWSKIEPYIDLVRKTVETLVMNVYLQTRKAGAENARQRYLYELLFEDREKLSEEVLVQGQALGVDVLSRYRCFCVSFADGKGRVPKHANTLFDSVQKMLRTADCSEKVLVYREMTQITIFLKIEEKEQMSDRGAKELERILKEQSVPANGIRLKIGIDDKEYSGFELRNGRKRAAKSLKAAMNGNDIVYYGDLTTEIFLSEISEKSKQEYMQRIFTDMEKEEIERWVELLENFYESDGSIQKTSKKMFVHKNTLQYQLKKLASITGYDPRNIRNASVYQNAIRFWRTME